MLRRKSWPIVNLKSIAGNHLSRVATARVARLARVARVLQVVNLKSIASSHLSRVPHCRLARTLLELLEYRGL